MKILLIGATGNIGQEAVRELLSKGHRPVVGVRSLEKAKNKWGDAVEYVAFDFEKKETIAPSLNGIGKVFFIAPHNNPVSSVKKLLEEAINLGIQHVVFSSGRTTGDVEGRPLHDVERLVRNSGIPNTILRPGWFMQNFTSWLGETIKEEGMLFLPAGKTKTAFIDVRDIGAVVAEVLSAKKEHDGRIYELTCEEPLDHFTVADIIGKVSGKEVEYIPLDRGEFIKEMVKRGWTVDDAIYTADLYDFVRMGKEAPASPDVAEVLGRKPIEFLEFALDHRKAWS